VFRWADQLPRGRDQRPVGGIARRRASTAFLGAYAVGKARNVCCRCFRPEIGPILTHTATEKHQPACCRASRIPPARHILAHADFEPQGPPRRQLLLAPPRCLGSAWSKKFRPARRTAFASGWMAVRGVRRRRRAIAVLSSRTMRTGDGTVVAIKATEAENYMSHMVIRMSFSRYLADQWVGIAQVVPTQFEGGIPLIRTRTNEAFCCPCFQRIDKAPKDDGQSGRFLRLL